MIMLSLIPANPGLAFVTNSNLTPLFVRATATGRVKEQWDGGRWKGGDLLQVLPDGSLLVHQDVATVLFSKEGKQRWRIVDPKDGDDAQIHACVSPDGRSLAYATGSGLWIQSLRPGSVWRAVVKPTALERRFGELTWTIDSFIVWSPDSRRLAFAAAIGPGDGSDYEEWPTVVEVDLSKGSFRRRGPGRPMAWTASGLYVLRRREWKIYDAYRLSPSGASTLLGRRVLGGAVSRGRILMLVDRRSWTARTVIRIPGTSDDTDFGPVVGL